MGAYRDDEDAVRARVEGLEAELAAAIHELHVGACHDPAHAELERHEHALLEVAAKRGFFDHDVETNAQLATKLETLRAELHDLESALDGEPSLAARLSARNADIARLDAVRAAVALVPRKQAALAKVPKPVIVLRRSQPAGRLAFPFTLAALGLVAEGVGGALFGVPGLVAASVFGLGTTAYAAYSEQRRRHLRQIAPEEVTSASASARGADPTDEEPLFARADALAQILAEVRELVQHMRAQADAAGCTRPGHATLRERVERLEIELGTAPHFMDRHPATFRRRVLERAIAATRAQVHALRSPYGPPPMLTALDDARRRQRALDPYRPSTALVKIDPATVRKWPVRRVIEPGLIGIVLSCAVMLMPVFVHTPLFVFVGLATMITTILTHAITDVVLRRRRRDADLLSSAAAFGTPWPSVDRITFDARGFTLAAGSRRHRVESSGDYARACELVLDAASEHAIVVRGAPPLALTRATPRR